MPCYYAHNIFGSLVLDKLPAEYAGLITRENSGWVCGLMGPDPLMFHPKYNRMARDLHRQTVVSTLERLAPSVRSGDDQALGLASGLICHYVLDRACHPDVLNATDSKYSHSAIEAEYDRHLLQRDGYERLRKSIMPMPTSKSVYRAAAQAWPGVTPGEYSLALHTLKRATDVLTYASGTGIKTVYDFMTRKLKPMKSLSGAVIGKHSPEELEPEFLKLDSILAENAEDTAKLVEKTMFAMYNRLPLDMFENVDYYGNSLDD